MTVTLSFPVTIEGLVSPSSSLPWIDVEKDHGAVGNGIADDTVPMQAAIDAAAAAGGGVVYCPGTYNIAGPHKNPTTAAGQLLLPSIDAGASAPIPIMLLGKVPPYKSLAVARTINTPTGVSVIKSTLPTSGGALLAAYGPSAVNENFTNITFYARNITFRMPANPQSHALGLRKVAGVSLDNVTIDTGQYGQNNVEPTNAVVCGARLPMTNNGAHTVLRNLTVAGFYNGLDCYEHTDLDNSQIWYCRNGLILAAAQNYPSRVGRLLVANCKTAVKVTGTHHFSVEQLAIEHYNPAVNGAKWYEPAADLDDAGNLGKGRITYHVVKAAVGIANGDFTKTGGSGVLCRSVASLGA